MNLNVLNLPMVTEAMVEGGCEPTPETESLLRQKGDIGGLKLSAHDFHANGDVLTAPVPPGPLTVRTRAAVSQHLLRPRTQAGPEWRVTLLVPPACRGTYSSPPVIFLITQADRLVARRRRTFAWQV